MALKPWGARSRRQEPRLKIQASAKPLRARTPLTVKISEVQREEVTWLWSNRIPRGKLTIIEGDPGVGKSFLSQAIAGAVTRGIGLPGEEQAEPATVLLMSAEDGLGDTIRPRLEDMGADLTRVIALRGLIDTEGKERPLTLADLDVIEKAITEHRPALVIVDPIIAYVAGKDTHGGLDAYGCHNNRKAGGYHCHRGPLAGESFSSKEEMLRKLGAEKREQQMDRRDRK